MQTEQVDVILAHILRNTSGQSGVIRSHVLKKFHELNMNILEVADILEEFHETIVVTEDDKLGKHKKEHLHSLLNECFQFSGDSKTSN